MKTFRLHLELVKMPMSLMISFSAVFGFIMHSNGFSNTLLMTGSGILFLACGGACLNNYQDRDIDRRFSRTRNRALPSSQLSPERALRLSIFLILLALFILYRIHDNFLLPLLGTVSILLYNGIYTPLKSRTILAIIPGTLCGMLPPFIGWTAAGGNPSSLTIISTMVFFGLWQLPHFWLIQLHYSSEYSGSAMPNMLSRLNHHQLEKIVFIWIANFSVMLLFLPVLYWGNKALIVWLFFAAAMILSSAAFLSIIKTRRQKNYRPVFRLLNGTVLFIMIAVIVERLM